MRLLNMRTSLILVLISVTLMPLVGCITPGQIPTEPQPLPEVVVQQFIAALADNDWPKAQSLLSAGAANKTRQAKLVHLAEQWNRDDSSARVMGVKTNGHTAVVAVIRMTAGGQFTSDLMPVYLHEANDLWRISSQVTSPEPDMETADVDALKKWYASKASAILKDVNEPQ